MFFKVLLPFLLIFDSIPLFACGKIHPAFYELNPPRFQRLVRPFQVKSENRPTYTVELTRFKLDQKMFRSHEDYQAFFKNLAPLDHFSKSPSLFPSSPAQFRTWVALDLSERGSIQKILRLSSLLGAQTGYRPEKYIFVLLPGISAFATKQKVILRVAPILTQNGLDLGISKHVALAEGKPVVAAGELEINESPNSLEFNLKSGTYMNGLPADAQAVISQATFRFFQLWLGSTWKVHFNPHTHSM